MPEVRRDDRLEEKKGTPARGKGSGQQGGGRRAKAAEKPAPEAAPAAPPQPKEPPRLLKRYREEVVPALMAEFGYRNPMEVPKVSKVVLNIGLGEAVNNPRAVESAARDLAAIAGQKPVVTKARKSIAGFKLRAGTPIGVSVTVRGARMYHLLDKLFNAVLPRIRDFRGVPRDSFDGQGNYSLGLREQIIFPEVEYAQIDRIRGLQITIVTTAKRDEHARRLLELLGMPFTRQS